MRPALTIAGKDLRQRFRDRSAIVLCFVAPMAIATLMSFAFQGAEHFHIRLGLVDGDRGAVAAALVDALHSPGLRDVVTVERFTDVSAAARAVKAGKVDAGLAIPVGFTAATTSGRAASLQVLTSVAHDLAGQVTRSIAQSFVSQVDAARLSVATAVGAGAPVARIAELSARAAARAAPMAVTTHATGARRLRPVSYFGPAMAIFFLFFAIAFTSRGYFVEQSAGTLERMAAAVRPSEIVIGKALSVAVYGTLSLATMVILTSVAFGADWGGPLPATLLCGAMVLAVLALTALVIVTARTERQAEGLSSIVTFGLALLGGNFVFLSTAPKLMRRLSLLTPNGWALRGFVDLATGPHSLAATTRPLLGIAAFTAAVVVVALGTSRLRSPS